MSDSRAAGFAVRHASMADFGVALAGHALPAHAADPLLGPTKTGSITIHKLKAPETSGGGSVNNRVVASTGLPDSGTESYASGLTPIEGVAFSIQQVDGIDLTTKQGWQEANELSDAYDPSDAWDSIAAAGYMLAAGPSIATDANGEASLSGLPLGLYLVAETSWPAGTTPSDPFLVSVPMTSPTNRTLWMYDVQVYPTNSVDGVTKAIDDKDAVKVGDTVRWMLNGDIPNVNVIDGYKITDELDSKLTYVGATVSLAKGSAITQGADYTAIFNAARNTLTVEFSAAGRDVLAANSATAVVVEVETTVNEVGEIANTALLYPNEASYQVRPGDPGGPTKSPEVITKWGSINLEKTNPDGALVAGAVFSVFSNQANAEAGTNAIVIDGVSEFTTGADGQATISGLRYSNWANGAAVSPGGPSHQAYWLKEVAAPEGYELLTDPIEFTVTAATTAVRVDLEVENVPSNSQGGL